MGLGFGSVAAGVPTLLSHHQVIRQAGVQAIAWGAIDAALAWYGRRAWEATSDE